MLTLDLGPLALSLSHALLLGSLLLASLTGWWLGRRSARNPEGVLFLLLLIALLVARIAFVARYFDEYEQSPWQMLDVRDGGFLIWPGLLAALLVAAGLAWRDRLLRKPLLGALAVGVLVWGGGQLVLRSLEQVTRLPELALRDMDGQPVQLHDYLGKPLVINLWATWCPPCRREMPVLAKAQAREQNVTFLIVNQGEGEAEIRRFLAHSGLELDNLLLDGGGRLGQQVGSRALPTTLFYDAQGRQVGSHLGELSQASLARALESLRPAP